MAQAAAIALPIIGGGFQAAGQIRAGNEAKRVGQAQNRIAQTNAILVERQAEARSQQIGAEGARILGAQRTGYAFSGVDVNQGSPLLMMADTMHKTALDQTSAIFQGRYEAAGFRYSGAEAERAGKIAQIESRYAAAGSIIGGLSGGAKAAAAGQQGAGG